MKLDRALVRTLLTRAEAFDWSLQGFGMFRLYVTKELRLHVWTDEFKQPAVTTVHTHPWDFGSTVLQGHVTDLRYIKVDGGGLARWEQKIQCGEGACTVGERTPVCLLLTEERRVVVGQCYGRRANDIHESIPSNGCITLVERRFREDTEHAYVYYPHDASWVSAEPRKATITEVRRMAEIALSVKED